MKAEEKLTSARILAERGQSEDSLFWCHQTIELALKGVIEHRTRKLPPKIHRLKGLAELAGYKDVEPLVELDPIYIEARYPEHHGRARPSSASAVSLARRILQWCESQVK